jgi:hypothetical protein
MLEQLKSDAVVSKFVTHRECLSYRQAIDDMLGMLRAVPLCGGPSRDGPAWVSAVWNDALDAAARVADEQWCMENSLIGSRLSRKIADAIRDLKHSNATQREGAADVD